MLNSILEAADEAAVLAVLRKSKVSVRETWISGDSPVDRAFKLWSYVLLDDGKYVVRVSPDGGGPVPVRGPRASEREGLVPREVVIGEVHDADMDAFVTELWQRHAGFHFAIGRKTLRRCVRSLLVLWLTSPGTARSCCL